VGRGLEMEISRRHGVTFRKLASRGEQPHFKKLVGKRKEGLGGVKTQPNKRGKEGEVEKIKPEVHRYELNSNHVGGGVLAVH